MRCNDAYRPWQSSLQSKSFNPFRPTGPFMAPLKIIILIKDLISFYYSKCCFNVSLCRTRCELSMAIMYRTRMKKKKKF